jgi:hypothetical protein
MRILRNTFGALLLFLALDFAKAQPFTTTNVFNLTILPPSSTITNPVYFGSGSTNAIALTVNNRDVLTNIVIRAMFGTNVGTNSLQFRDTGTAPDQTADDGTFTRNIVMPITDVVTNFTMDFTAIGEDFTFVNPDPSMPEAAFVTNAFSVTYIIVPTPRNDKFTNAFKVDAAGGVVTSTNNFATLDIGEPVHGQIPTVSASVWWTWSPNVDASVLIDTAGTSFPSILAVYTNQTLTQLKQVASSTNDVINRLPPNVVFNATKGTTYRIAIAGPNASTNSVGDIRLRVAPRGTPDNRPPTVSISSPATGALVASEQLVVSGTAHEVFENDAGVSNIVLQVNSGPFTNAVGTASWSGVVTLPPGTNFVRAFAVDFAGNRSQADTITIRYLSPTNDLFANAVQLQGTSGLVTAENRGSTKELDEPLHADNEGGRSVWYKWRSSSVGQLTLTTQNSTFDTLLAVYSGASLATLLPVTSNDDSFEASEFSQVSFTVNSNQLYYVAVDGFGGEFGTLVLQHFFEPTEQGRFFSVTINNSPGGTVSPPTGLYPANARVTLTAQPDASYEFVTWEGFVSSPDNPLTLTVADNIILTPRFRVSRFTDDFESGDLTRLAWATLPDTGWFVQTNTTVSGKFSARSGLITDGGTSSLVLVTNTGPGTASFQVRVSCEAFWDKLAFYLNDSALAKWSGETNIDFSFPVPSGLNRFEWRYVKDGNVSLHLDGVFLDNLFLPPNIFPATTGTLSLFMFAEGAQITVVGEAGRTYLLEASNDMRSWAPVSSKNSASGVVHFLDTRAPAFSTRFYRTVAQ